MTTGLGGVVGEVVIELLVGTGVKPVVLGMCGRLEFKFIVEDWYRNWLERKISVVC